MAVISNNASSTVIKAHVLHDERNAALDAEQDAAFDAEQDAAVDAGPDAAIGAEHERI